MFHQAGKFQLELEISWNFQHSLWSCEENSDPGKKYFRKIQRKPTKNIYWRQRTYQDVSGILGDVSVQSINVEVLGFPIEFVITECYVNEEWIASDITGVKFQSALPVVNGLQKIRVNVDARNIPVYWFYSNFRIVKEVLICYVTFWNDFGNILILVVSKLSAWFISTTLTSDLLGIAITPNINKYIIMFWICLEQWAGIA